MKKLIRAIRLTRLYHQGAWHIHATLFYESPPTQQGSVKAVEHCSSAELRHELLYDIVEDVEQGFDRYVLLTSPKETPPTQR